MITRETFLLVDLRTLWCLWLDISNSIRIAACVCRSVKCFCSWRCRTTCPAADVKMLFSILDCMHSGRRMKKSSSWEARDSEFHWPPSPPFCIPFLQRVSMWSELLGRREEEECSFGLFLPLSIFSSFWLLSLVLFLFPLSSSRRGDKNSKAEETRKNVKKAVEFTKVHADTTLSRWELIYQIDSDVEMLSHLRFHLWWSSLNIFSDAIIFRRWSRRSNRFSGQG